MNECIVAQFLLRDGVILHTSMHVINRIYQVWCENVLVAAAAEDLLCCTK